MKFKLTLTIIACFFILSSCKNQDSRDHTSETAPASEEFPSQGITGSGNQGITGSENKEQDPSKRESTPKPPEEDLSMTLQGQYIKVGQQADLGCGCYCLDLNFTSTSELCLSPDTIYINVKFEKAGANRINVYLTSPSELNSEGEEIPWDLFDRNLPIATLAPQGNGELELDWLGFSINGALAMDYAIFGKKTLEGKFKKKQSPN